jgi:hypothetical protein
LNWSQLIRQGHRWASIVFTLTVLTCFAVLGLGQAESLAWVFYLPLAPLAFLMFSGLYLFVLPYLARRRRAAPGA